MGKRGLAFGSAWRLSPWEDWGPSALESLEVGLEAPPCGFHWKWRWRPFVGALQRCPSYDMAVFCPLKLGQSLTQLEERRKVTQNPEQQRY